MTLFICKPSFSQQEIENEIRIGLIWGDYSHHAVKVSQYPKPFNLEASVKDRFLISFQMVLPQGRK
jgi:hypothetical protein